MNAVASVAGYTLRGVEQMLGLPRGVVLGLVEAGFVNPGRGPRNEHRFSFRDVVLLRMAHELRAANIPSRRLLQSLRQLKARLPQELPMAGLRIQAVGNDVVVRDGDARWDARTGQLLLELEVAAAAQGQVAFLRRDAAAPAELPTAAQLYSRAEQLEHEDPAGAEAVYRQALELAPDHEYAWLNLGALLCEAGRCDEAVVLYDRALQHCPDAPLLHFNRAIALEDLRRDDDALAGYQRCLALQPDFADAHFNAARLHDKLGQAQGALRHYSAYRRLHPTPA